MELKAMSLRHALLGLIADKPMSGYELSKRFAAPAHVWSAKHSQIYPELARLLQAGLIRHAESGPRGRKTYEITDAGLEEVRKWLIETQPDRTARDESFLRVFFLWLVEPAQARAYLQGELDYHRSLLAHYEGTFGPGQKPRTPAERWSWVCLQAGILHERALAEWAEWALSQVSSSRSTRAATSR
jgi:PadR family transcriptional regulator, regulatory protein AphA